MSINQHQAIFRIQGKNIYPNLIAEVSEIHDQYAYLSDDKILNYYMNFNIRYADDTNKYIYWQAKSFENSDSVLSKYGKEDIIDNYIISKFNMSSRRYCDQYQIGYFELINSFTLPKIDPEDVINRTYQYVNAIYCQLMELWRPGWYIINLEDEIENVNYEDSSTSRN